MKTPTVKFRGVSVDSEEVYFGFLFVANGKSYIVSDETFIAGYPAMWSAEVHPESVAQYIGLNDRNGKEIYGSVYVDGKLTKSGDVAELDGEIYTVEFEDGAFGLKKPEQKLKGLFHYYNFCRVDHSHYVPEVLGSQFLNPELVKG